MDETSRIDLHLERLPRTIMLVRAGNAASCASLTPAAREALDAHRRAASVPDAAPVLVLLDQTLLPGEEAYVCTADWQRVIDAIQRLEVRGAPAIGIAGAAAVALRAAELADQGIGPESLLEALASDAQVVRDARPTAVNLAVGVDAALAEAQAALGAGKAPQAIAGALFALVQRMVAGDEAANRAMGANGAALLQPGSRILTHCNAGSLATAFYGTALGVVYAAAEQGKVSRVYADETRPVGQGARLTVWELAQASVPVTLICDDMAASVMAQGLVDAVIVGADRIAANGDVANKIGTYGVAVLARYHGIPFYVVAPTSTIDLGCPNGAAIPIEQRAAEEVLPTPIPGVEVLNPSFDVTPADLVSAVVTERGVFAPSDMAAACAAASEEGA